MILAYLSTLTITLLGVLTPWGLLVFLSLPLAIKLLRQMETSIPADADAQTAKLDTAFGSSSCSGSGHPEAHGMNHAGFRPRLVWFTVILAFGLWFVTFYLDWLNFWIKISFTRSHAWGIVRMGAHPEG
ncbi:MAG: hypothetical protein MZU95_11775 [Desulfomicrobium escambiense]|nr:hypothetical protein [Desulfomicrobium escambiense]